MEENVIFIGKKPTMSYVLAVVTRFSAGNAAVTLKARGKIISKAVDVAEVARNRFVQDAVIDSIHIGTEEVEDANKEKLNVSTIAIKLAKKM